VGNVRVKVNISNIARGPSHEKTTVYKRGQEFICSEEESKKLGKDVTVLETIEEPETNANKLAEYATVETVDDSKGTVIVETESGKNVKIKTKR